MGSNRKNPILILQYWEKKNTFSIYLGTNNIFVDSTYTQNDIKRIILINQYFLHKIIPSSFSTSIILRYFYFYHFFLNPFLKSAFKSLKVYFYMEFNIMISLFWNYFRAICALFPSISTISAYFRNFCIFLQFLYISAISATLNCFLHLKWHFRNAAINIKVAKSRKSRNCAEIVRKWYRIRV